MAYYEFYFLFNHAKNTDYLSFAITYETKYNKSDLYEIWRLANMTLRELINESGLSQTVFSERFYIPLRTVRAWANGTNKCADYVKLLLANEIGIITIPLEFIRENNK